MLQRVLTVCRPGCRLDTIQSWVRVRTHARFQSAVASSSLSDVLPAQHDVWGSKAPAKNNGARAPPNPPPATSTGLKLRDYQEECVRSVVHAIRDGRRQVGVSLATGSGKTVVFTELIERVAQPNPGATQTLVLAHRRELVEQAARTISRRYPEKIVEIEMGNLKASGYADVTVASIQSIASRDRVDKFRPDRFKLIMVDEAHHIVAPNYLKVLGHFGLVSEEEDAVPALVGVSATMARFDGLALGKVIKHIVYHKDYIDMIGQKWLSQVLFTTVKIKADLSKVQQNASGDFAVPALSKAINTPENNYATFLAWQKVAGKKRKSTLGFCVDLLHVEKLTAEFRRNGVACESISGHTSWHTRSDRLERFKLGEYPVLLNCAVFTEGTDIPNIDCVLLARPTRSRNLLVQMIGRGMRLHAGKKDCHVIDMVASLESGIVTTPTLFGLDPDDALTGATGDEARELKAQKEEEELANPAPPEPEPAQPTGPINISMTFRDYDSVNELIEESSGERFIRAISKNAWVHVGPDRYILTNGSQGSYLDLHKLDERLYEVKFVQKFDSAIEGATKVPFARPRTVATAEAFESAVHAADTYASRRFTRPMILKQAAWRDRPASEAQVAYLNKFRDEDDQLDPEEVTKGKAMDMITKMKFGARGQLKQLGVKKRKHEMEIKKWEQQKEAERKRMEKVVEKRAKKLSEFRRKNASVKVGPLRDVA